MLLVLSPWQTPDVKSHFRCRPILLLDEDPTLELKTLVWGTAHSESPNRAEPIGRYDACAICGAVLARSAADVKHESALGKGFRSPCRGRSLGRPAPSEPMKLLPGARTRLWALVSF